MARDEVAECFLSLTEKIITLQLGSAYQKPRHAFSRLMTNEYAAGYVFGFHDSFLQRCGLLNPIKPIADFALMQASYQRIFGDKAGLALLEISLSLQDHPDFHDGRLLGGEEIAEFLDTKKRPLGLEKILFVDLNKSTSDLKSITNHSLNLKCK